MIILNKKGNHMGIGDWGLGIGDWGLGPIPNPHENFSYMIYRFKVI